MKALFNILFLLLVLIPWYSFAQNQATYHGTVFLDKNADGLFNKNEPGLKGICISNGKEVVQTNEKGEWESNASVANDIFVIKPAGYAVPVNSFQNPIHFVQGEKGNRAEINFPLIEQEEKKQFDALFFGDTQAREMKEVNYIFHDVVEELIGSKAAFGVTLGDIVADDPELMDDVAAGIAQIGIPWYNIIGNHDNDRDAKTNDDRDNTFEKFFGPSTYAFEYADVVFIGLNDIFFKPDGKYISHFTERQLEFVKNYLQFVPENKLVVLMMHSPIIACDNREAMFRPLENRPNTFSISGHVHEQLNLFVDEKMGWKGKKLHHHLINATVCGSWWCGLKDETGIPHATMNDGAPNGYSIISFDGNKYSVQFKAARRPADYQMNIYLPDALTKTMADTTHVLVNVFAGSEKSVVEMQVDNGNWIKMENFKTIDPEILRMHQLSPYLDTEINGKKLDDIFGYSMDFPSVSTHIWKAEFPKGIAHGTHKITVRTTDMYNQTYTAHRIFNIN
jgi:hypothetical protein